MNEATAKTIDQEGNEVLDPKKTLTEQTLAVDLAGVEIDRQIATAHKFPRVIDTVMRKIATLALYNRESAESCIYALPRGGKPIIGPSIGYANIVSQAWGNCRVGARIVYVDVPQKVVIAEGAFLDLETNTQSIVPVTRRIVDSKGRIYNADMINVTGMAAASIARRNAILQGVSRGLWHPIWMDALGIVRGDVKTFAENKDAAFKALAQFGLTPEKIIMSMGLKGEADLTFEHIPTLRGIYVALRDGSMTVEELTDPRRMTGKGFETVSDPLGDAAEDTDATAAMGEAPQAAEPQGADPNTPKQADASAATAATPKPALKVVEKQPEATAKTTDIKPKNAVEYLEYWGKFCAAATSAMAVQNQYAADRQLRKDCSPFDQEQNEQIVHLKDKRLSELRQ